MERSGIQEILKELQLNSKHMDEKLSEMWNRMDKRFDRIEKKIGGMRVELIET